MTGFAVVLPLLLLQLSIDLRNERLEIFRTARLGARTLHLLEMLPDSPDRHLGEIEVQLLVLEQLQVALKHAAPDVQVGPARAGSPLAGALPDISLSGTPP